MLWCARTLRLPVTRSCPHRRHVLRIFDYGTRPVCCGDYGPCFTAAKQPNFVFILTDDQNSLLGDMEPMVKTRSLIAERGATFTHGNVVTPVCCPSRTTILSGRYPHNTLATPGEPYDCMHMNVTAPAFQQQTVAAYMSKLGYNSVCMRCGGTASARWYAQRPLR